MIPFLDRWAEAFFYLGALLEAFAMVLGRQVA